MTCVRTLHHWRRQVRRAVGRKVRFLPASVSAEKRPSAVGSGLIEIELGNGVWVRVDGSVDEAALSRFGAETRCGWRAGAAGAGDAEARPSLRAPVRIPRQRGGLVKIQWHDGRGCACSPNAWPAAASCGRGRRARR